VFDADCNVIEDRIELCVLDTTQFERTWSVKLPHTPLESLAFDSSGKILICISRDGKLSKWKIGSNEPAVKTEIGTKVLASTDLAAPRRLAILTSNDVVIISLDDVDERLSIPLGPVKGRVDQLAGNTQSGNLILTSGSSDSRINLGFQLNVETKEFNRLKSEFSLAPGSPVSPSGDLIVGSVDGYFHLFQVDQGSIRKRETNIPISPELRGLHVRATHLAIWGNSEWGNFDGDPSAIWLAENFQPKAIRFSPDGKLILIAGAETRGKYKRGIAVMDVGSGEIIDWLEAQKANSLENIVELNDGRLIGVDFNGTLQIWKAWWAADSFEAP
jgi:WD40 repeat protein